MASRRSRLARLLGWLGALLAEPFVTSWAGISQEKLDALIPDPEPSVVEHGIGHSSIGT